MINLSTKLNNLLISCRYFVKLKKIKVGGLLLKSHEPHYLALYKKLYPKYDEILPNLVTFLDSPEWVVDIGANIGDSVAAMIQKNSKVKYFCIEGDVGFYDDLKINVNRILQIYKGSTILTNNSIVGSAIKAGTLRGSGGTKSLSQTSIELGIGTKSIDELVKISEIKKVVLIKSDVDGYDFDVINSGLGVIVRDKPILFFEVFPLTVFSRDGYLRLIENLAELGYLNFLIFDNFGNLVSHSSNVNNIKYEINSLHISLKSTNVKVRYFDFLLYRPDHKNTIDRFVAAL
jgi:FkbM family methyltransferase